MTPKTTGLLLLAALCALPAAAELSFAPHVFTAASGEEVQAELGVLSVPESRSATESRQLSLHLVRFKSTAERPGPPIVYLAGGPGGSGIDAARGTRFPLFMALRAFGDVIAFDQRGTGRSGGEQLDCDDRFMIPLGEPLDRNQAADIVAAAVRRCFDRLREAGIDLSAYNTRESAADLEDLRRALGVPKLTLWGISYGTHLALAALREHGDHIERVVLAGLEGLHHSWKLPSDQQELLAEIARLARRDPAVEARVPDLLASIEGLLHELEREPRAVELAHPDAPMPMRVVLGSFDLQVALAGMLRGPSSFAAMPDVIARLEAGDWTPLALFALGRRFGEAPHAMSVAMDCASGAGASWRQRIAREAPATLLGDAINFPYPELCLDLGIEDLGDRFRAPVISDVPALLISGTLDGRTPVRNGEEVLVGLSRGHHLVIEGAGHSDPLFLSSPKILETMEAFLGGGEPPHATVALPPVQLLAPRTVVPLGDHVLERYVGTYRIRGEDVRRVIKAGSLLYTRRGSGPALPIRPMSETQFFYEGAATHLTFQTDAGGTVTGMLVFHDHSSAGEPAEKTE